MSGYPENEALATWEHEAGAICSIARMKQGHLCGYARFPKRPVREEGYDGILRFVPVHGGLTYAQGHDDGSMVYGFDCTHSGDAVPIEFERYPQYRDPNGRVWTEAEVARETTAMVVAILIAAKYERRYLRCTKPKGRARVIDEYHELLSERGIVFDLNDNFGAMISVLGGELT